MAVNNFKPFAIGAGANVTSQSEWEGLMSLATGFTAGLARSGQVNKAIRQGTVMASVLAQFMADTTGSDILDDGDMDALNSHLISAIKSLITQTSINIDSVYPVGVVIFFAQNKNPNTLFPGTTWNYIGEDKVIRLAKQDGSDVLKTRGSDSVTISKNNLPNVQLDVTGTAAESVLGTLSTTEAGGHAHKGKYAESNTSIDGGSSNRRSWATDYGYSEEGLIESVPNHAHQVTIPDHGHQISGKTAAMGNGASINVINACITLMGWYRSA